MKTVLKALAGASACIALASSGAVYAQAYPSKPIRMIVAYGPGSGADIIGRIVADKLAEQMKVSIVVENRDGAGGAIGTAYVAKAPGDGYTLLLAPTTLTVSPSMMAPNPTYDAIKDFIPVTKIAVLPMAIVTSPNSPFKTFDDLIAYAKANPGKVNYATSGKGSPSHLEAELLRQRYGIQINDIPYKSGGQAMTDTISGQVMFYFPVLPAALSNVTAGRLRSLAVGTQKRSDKAPNVPTLAELLPAPGYEASVWYGVIAPKGTPPDVVAKLDTEIQKALATPEVRAKIEKTGSEISVQGHEQFSPFVKSEVEKWDKLVKQLNLKSNE